MGGLEDVSFKHNTLRLVDPRVGSINAGTTGGSGTYTENLMHGGDFNEDFGPIEGGGDGGCATTGTCTFTHNMFSGTSTGTNNIAGTPTYTGGASPSTWQGWKLTGASTGHNAALDNGHDMGSNYFNPPAPTNFQEP